MSYGIVTLWQDTSGKAVLSYYIVLGCLHM